jgi:hypothetical protein
LAGEKSEFFPVRVYTSLRGTGYFKAERGAAIKLAGEETRVLYSEE